MEVPYLETGGEEGMGLPVTQERLRRKNKRKTKPMLQF